jgi:hypothetical protein
VEVQVLSTAPLFAKSLEEDLAATHAPERLRNELMPHSLHRLIGWHPVSGYAAFALFFTGQIPVAALDSRC